MRISVRRLYVNDWWFPRPGRRSMAMHIYKWAVIVRWGQ